MLARAFAQVMEEANAKTAHCEREVQEHRRTDRGARPPRRARAPVQRGGRIIQRRHHHDVARRHHHRLEFGRGTAVRLQPRRKPRARTSRSWCPTDRLPEVQDTLRRIGWGESIEHNETMRLRKDGTPDRGLAQHFPDQGAVGRDHRHIEGRPRHHRQQQDPAGAAAADRGAAPRLRDFAGPDHGDGFEGIRGPDQPELRRPSSAIRPAR